MSTSKWNEFQTLSKDLGLSTTRKRQLYYKCKDFSEKFSIPFKTVVENVLAQYRGNWEKFFELSELTIENIMLKKDRQLPPAMEPSPEIDRLTTELQETQRKLQETQRKLQETQGKLQENEGKLQENEGKLQETEGKLQENEGKLHQCRELLRGEKQARRSEQDKFSERLRVEIQARRSEEDKFSERLQTELRKKYEHLQTVRGVNDVRLNQCERQKQFEKEIHQAEIKRLNAEIERKESTIKALRASSQNQQDTINRFQQFLKDGHEVPLPVKQKMEADKLRRETRVKEILEQKKKEQELQMNFFY
jgi:chromosome segregation ATPase